jgi:hypothetical protein
MSLKSKLILNYHLLFGLPSGFLPSGFTTNSFHAFLFSPYMLHAPPNLITTNFITLIIFGEKNEFTAHTEVIHAVSNITT